MTAENKINMLDAKEAYKSTCNEIAKTDYTVIKECEKSISAAIHNGNFSCDIYQALNLHTIKNLEQLGYKVKDFSNQKDGCLYEISWDLGDENKNEPNYRKRY